MGGLEVCGACNKRANEVADELIGKDFLMRFLRALYEIRDRHGKRPSPPVFALRLPHGGVVEATLHKDRPTFRAGMPPSVAESLRLDDLTDQEGLRHIFAEALGGERAADRRSLELAQVAPGARNAPRRVVALHDHCSAVPALTKSVSCDIEPEVSISAARMQHCREARAGGSRLLLGAVAVGQSNVVVDLLCV
jgi:hypothetical protein